MPSIALPPWLPFIILLLHTELSSGAEPSYPCLTLNLATHKQQATPATPCEDGTPPLFTWTNAEYKTEISTLLSGKEVSLTADITKYPETYQALTLIDITMKFIRKSTKEDLDYYYLKPFSVKMKHSGSSHFRVGDTFYTVKHPPLDLIYSLSDHTTVGDDKGFGVISPFTKWTVKMTLHEFNAFAFDNLDKKYKNEEIDLQFCGKIQYFKPGEPWLIETKGEDRDCYCDWDLDSYIHNKVCNHDLECFSCTGKGCNHPSTKKCGLAKDRLDKVNPMKCFLSYDGSGPEPKLEAGCKDFGRNPGPDSGCEKVDQHTWIGSKELKSCTCTSSTGFGFGDTCNEFRSELLPSDDHDRTGTKDSDQTHGGKKGNAGEALKISWTGLVAFMGAVLYLF